MIYYLLESLIPREERDLQSVLDDTNVLKTPVCEALLREYLAIQWSGDRDRLKTEKFRRFWLWENTPDYSWEWKENGRFLSGFLVPNIRCEICDTTLNAFLGVTEQNNYPITLPKRFKRKIDEIRFISLSVSQFYSTLNELIKEIEDYYLSKGISICLQPGDCFGILSWDTPLYWDKFHVFGIFDSTETNETRGFIFDECAFDSLKRKIDCRNLLFKRVKVKSRFYNSINNRYYCVTNKGTIRYTNNDMTDQYLEICPSCGYRTLRTDKYNQLVKEWFIKRNIRNSKLRKMKRIAKSDIEDSPFFAVDTYDGLIVEETFKDWFSTIDHENRFKFTKLTVDEET